MLNLSGLLREHRRRKAIRLYVTKLGPVLARLFGRREHYTPDQVRRAAQEAKLPAQDLCYGLAIYCTPEDFDAYHAATGQECHYWEMRVEVAEQHFHGNGAFTAHDVTAHAQAHSHAHAGAEFGGGHHFGDGGGGGHHGGH